MGSNVNRLDGVPAIGIPYWVNLHLSAGKLMASTLSTMLSTFPALMSILRTRYGKPGAATTERVTTIGGAEVTAEVVEWSGRAVKIIASSRLTRIDEASAIFIHLPTQQERQDEKAKRLTEGASKL